MPRKPKYYVRPDGLHETIRKIDGKRVAFRGNTDAEVDRKMIEYRGKIESGRIFKDVESEWETECWKNLSPNSIRNYCTPAKIWVDEFGKDYIKEISPADIDKVLKRIAITHAQKTVNAYKLVINLIMRQAIIAGDITVNPVNAIAVPKGRPKSPRELPLDKEVEIIKKNADTPYGLLHLFVYYTGARKGEALAIQFKNIDRKAGTITISKSLYYNPSLPEIKSPKTAAGTRTVPILAPLLVHLPQGDPEEYLFPLERKTTMERHLRAYRAKTEIACTLHQLRHAYATSLYEAGIDVKEAQELLGHASSQMTMDIYTHIRKSRMDGATTKLNTYFNTQSEHSMTADA